MCSAIENKRVGDPLNLSVKMKLRALLFIGALVLATTAANAQTSTPRTKAKVGVNTKNPTENLHVNGTLRVQTLPVDKTNNAISTKTDGSGSTSATPDQTFNAMYVVTADKNGVLGRAPGADPAFFYMPALFVPTKADQVTAATPLVTHATSGVFTVKLFDNYAHQFGVATTTGMPAVVSSNPASTKLVTSTPTAADFDYFITYYDDSVFEDVKVNASGVLTYKVKAGSTVTAKTYMNIIFKKKS